MLETIICVFGLSVSGGVTLYLWNEAWKAWRSGWTKGASLALLLSLPNALFAVVWIGALLS